MAAASASVAARISTFTAVVFNYFVAGHKRAMSEKLQQQSMTVGTATEKAPGAAGERESPARAPRVLPGRRVKILACSPLAAVLKCIFHDEPNIR
jgi:hypothetical protein